MPTVIAFKDRQMMMAILWWLLVINLQCDSANDCQYAKGHNDSKIWLQTCLYIFRVHSFLIQNIDILLSGLTISAARLEVVDFSFPFWEEKLGMIVGTVNYQNMYLVRPLHVYVWLCYGAMAFLTAAQLVAVSRNPGYDTLLYHFFYLLGGLCNEGKIRFEHEGPTCNIRIR